MNVSGLWVLFMVAGTALLVLDLSSSFTGSSSPDMVFSQDGESLSMLHVSRRLKESGFNPSNNKKTGTGDLYMNDYDPIDPAPSSKESIKPAPIEHSSPLMPFIPKPPPPESPQVDGFP